MAFEITIHVPAIDRLADAIAGRATASASNVALAASNVAVAASKNARAARAKEDAALEAAEEKADALSLDDITSAGKKYAADNGRDAFVELLKSFGVANLSALPKEQYADFIAKLTA